MVMQKHLYMKFNNMNMVWLFDHVYLLGNNSVPSEKEKLTANYQPWQSIRPSYTYHDWKQRNYEIFCVCSITGGFSVEYSRFLTKNFYFF